MDIKQSLNDLMNSGLSQDDISKKLGIGQSTVSELRSGKLKSVRYEVGKRLELLMAEISDKKAA